MVIIWKITSDNNYDLGTGEWKSDNDCLKEEMITSLDGWLKYNKNEKLTANEVIFKIIMK